MVDAWLAVLLIVGFFVGVGVLLFVVVSRAFRLLGLSAAVAVLVVGGSFLLGEGILDGVVGVPLSALPLVSVGLWRVGVNVGGAVIPLILCIYLVVKHRLPWGRVLVGLVLVASVAFVVTVPDVSRGIVSRFPWWLLPVVVASVGSVVLMHGRWRSAAPFAYVTGVCGVLLGADVLHLPALLGTVITESRTAVIGGASVFDMVFTTGLLAVLLDGLLMYQEKKEK
jgi:hypothetical protein